MCEHGDLKWQHSAASLDLCEAAQGGQVALARPALLHGQAPSLAAVHVKRYI